MNDDHFKQLLDYLHYSWAGYSRVRKAVKKRIGLHMQQLHCSRMKDYLALLETNTKEREECEKRMAVSISRFFRDRKLWLDLEEEILPNFIKSQEDRLKVWSAGCARGEEAYSFMIVWDRLKDRFHALPELELIATDMQPEYIDKAKTGSYTLSSLKEVPQEIRDFYFEKKKPGNRFDAKPMLKTNITWQTRNIFCGPPGFDFHIIFLRNNLLTYYENNSIVETFAQIMNSLIAGGCLIIGSHERLPRESSGLTGKLSNPWAFFKRRDL